MTHTFCQHTTDIAHELGHAINGHLEGKTAKDVRTRFGNVEVLNMNWQQEYEADITGLHLLLMNAIDEEKNDPTGKRGNAALAIASAMMFFSIDKMITEIYLFLTDISNKVLLNAKHPPADERIKNLQGFVEHLGISDHFYLAKSTIGLTNILFQNGLKKIENESHKFNLVI